MKASACEGSWIRAERRICSVHNWVDRLPCPPPKNPMVHRDVYSLGLEWPDNHIKMLSSSLWADTKFIVQTDNWYSASSWVWSVILLYSSNAGQMKENDWWVSLAFSSSTEPPLQVGGEGNGEGNQNSPSTTGSEVERSTDRLVFGTIALGCLSNRLQVWRGAGWLLLINQFLSKGLVLFRTPM